MPSSLRSTCRASSRGWMPFPRSVNTRARSLRSSVTRPPKSTGLRPRARSSSARAAAFAAHHASVPFAEAVDPAGHVRGFGGRLHAERAALVGVLVDLRTPAVNSGLAIADLIPVGRFALRL